MADNNVDVSTLAIKVTTAGAAEAKAELSGVADSAASAETRAEGLSESSARLAARFVSLAAVAAAVGTALRFSLGEYITLESATANLSAKTGLMGESLAIVVERAKELSTATTQSAAAILDAAEQVEGLVPRLNGNAAAIAEVTAQAVLLAEATGDELGPSVYAVGQALAQFGGDAADASRYANALVAAAQNGAAEVQDLAQQFERIGPAAARAGVSFEQTLAAMELLANRGIRGREAVGGLKEFFDRLATSTDANYNPALVGLDVALRNVAAASLTAKERTDLFGEAAADVSKVIVDNVGEFGTLTGAITGTTAAADQAAVLLGTLEGQAKIARNELSLLGAEVGENLAPYLREATEAGGFLVQMLRDSIDVDREASDAAKGFGGALDGLAFALGTTAQIVGGLVDVIRLFATITLSTANFLSGNFKDALGTAAEAWDDYAARVNERVREVAAAADRINNGPQARDVAPAAARDPAAAIDAEIDAWVAGYQRQLEARREVAAAELKIAQEAEKKRLEFLDNAQGKVFEAINDATNKEVDLAIEGELAKFQAEADIQERILELRITRQDELAELQKGWFETDLERTLESFDERESAVNEYFDSVTVPNEEERARRLAEIADQRERAITAVTKRGIISRDDFDKLNAKQKTQYALAQAEQLTAGIAQHNKAAFLINKTAAIANAIISTQQGAAEALKWGFPLGPIYAGIIAAAGVARVAAIASTSYEGGGGGTTPSSAGSTPTVNGQAAGGPSAPPPDLTTGRATGSQIQIIVAGNNVMDDAGVDRLVERIAESVNDRDVTVFGANSRQAQDVVIVQR